MKTLLLIALSTIPALAQAEAFVCHATNAGPDHGYFANVSADSESADVYTQSIAGPRAVASLDCRKLKTRPSHPDQELPFLSCKEPNVADAGYLLTLSSGGFTGLVTAKLEEQSFAGPQLVADLVCERK